MVPCNNQLILFETYIQHKKDLDDKNVSLNFPNNLHEILKNDYKRNDQKTYFDAKMDISKQNLLKNTFLASTKQNKPYSKTWGQFSTESDVPL